MRALICGVAGQDGAYLSKLLLEKGYEVFGTSRDADLSIFSSLTALGIREQVSTLSMALNDFRSVLQVLNKVEPDEIYNLSGQSSVGLSFDQPVETMESISLGALNILEAMRFLKKSYRFYSAGSIECFGDTKGEPADEDTPFCPRSPYAMAKSAAFWQVANYREAYGLFACTGILSNHESCLRPTRFVTKKIVETARRIANGSQERLLLGNIDVTRDWGWAPEYVDAMWHMLQAETADDYVIATGTSHSLHDFISLTFGEFGLDWHDHVESRTELMRPADIRQSWANPEKAHRILGWKATLEMPEIVKRLVRQQLIP